jgi:hypothetical protein
MLKIEDAHHLVKQAEAHVLQSQEYTKRENLIINNGIEETKNGIQDIMLNYISYDDGSLKKMDRSKKELR